MKCSIAAAPKQHQMQTRLSERGMTTAAVSDYTQTFALPFMAYSIAAGPKQQTIRDAEHARSARHTKNLYKRLSIYTNTWVAMLSNSIANNL